MPVEAVTMSEAKAFDRLRLALIGKEKSGKSRLAVTARKPVLVLDTDKRREALAGFKDVYVLTFTDPQLPLMPDAFPAILTVQTMIEQGATLKKIGEMHGQKEWPDVKPRTIVDDSLTTLGKSAMAYCTYNNRDLRRVISVAGTQVYLPSGWDAWSAEMALIETLILRQLGVPGLDVIVVYHETAEEAPQSTSEKPIYTGRIDFYPGRYRGLIKYFNEVWRVSREQGPTPVVQVIPDYRFTAATNLDFSKIPANEMKPDISYMIERSLGGK